MNVEALRFFRVVSPPATWVVAGSAALAIYWVAVLALDPLGAEADAVLSIVLLWQMLAASTGFVPQARAGIFDPILIAPGRARVVAGHLVHSTWIACALWLAVGASEVALGRNWPVTFEPGRVAALIWVSIAAWALTLPAPRLTGGALWVVAILGVAMSRVGADSYATLLAMDPGLARAVRAAAMAIVCPFLMFDTRLPDRVWCSVALVVTSAVVALAATRWLVRRSYPLGSHA